MFLVQFLALPTRTSDVFNNTLDFLSLSSHMLKHCCSGSTGYILLYNIAVDERPNADVGNRTKRRLNIFFCFYHFVCCYRDVRKPIDTIGVYLKKTNPFAAKHTGFSSGRRYRLPLCDAIPNCVRTEENSRRYSMSFNGNYKSCYSNFLKFTVMCNMHREIHKSMATMETNNSEIFFIRNFNCSRILAGRIFSSFNNFHGNLKQQYKRGIISRVLSRIY